MSFSIETLSTEEILIEIKNRKRAQILDCRKEIEERVKCIEYLKTRIDAIQGEINRLKMIQK